MTRRPQARPQARPQRPYPGKPLRPYLGYTPERRPNPWFSLLGLVAYAVVASAVLWALAAIWLALQP